MVNTYAKNSLDEFTSQAGAIYITIVIGFVIAVCTYIGSLYIKYVSKKSLLVGGGISCS